MAKEKVNTLIEESKKIFDKAKVIIDENKNTQNMGGEILKTAENNYDALLSKPSEILSPSHSIVAPNLPKSGLETKVSPSLIKTLEPAGASKSIKYVSPSQLYNFADSDLSIYSDYSKVKKISQVNELP